MTTINYGITFFQTRYRDKKLGVMIHFGEKMPYKEGFKSFDRASVLTSVTCTPLPTSEWLSGRLDLGSTISDQNWTERPLVVFVKEHLLLFVVFACCCALYLFQQPQFTGISAVTKTTRHFFLLELRSPRPPWSAFDQRVFQWLRCFRSSLVAQTVKNPSANIGDGRWGGGGWSLGWEDPLEEKTATHSSILAWEFHGQRSLVGYSPWSHKGLDTVEQLIHTPVLFQRDA